MMSYHTKLNYNSCSTLFPSISRCSFVKSSLTDMAEQLFSWSHQELTVQFDVWIRFSKNTHCCFLLIIFCYKNRLAKSRVHYRLHDTVYGEQVQSLESSACVTSTMLQKSFELLVTNLPCG